MYFLHNASAGPRGGLGGLSPHLQSEMVAKLHLVSIREKQMAISVYGGKNEC